MKLGISFSDSLNQPKFKHNLSHKPKRSPISRIIVAIFFLIIAFGILVMQTVRLQLFQGKSYRALADQNRMRTITLYAPRGIIYDRNNKPLVLNIPGYRQKMDNCNKPTGCTQILSRDEVIEKKAKGEELAHLQIDSLRQYVDSTAFAHVIGYVSEITKEELQDKDLQQDGYTIGDRLGRGGVESQYEDVLKGRKGQKYIETDAQGNEVRVLGRIDPVAGNDLLLTIDKDLQETAYTAMKDKVGAIVVSNPKTGEIFALVSTPSFDSNLFTQGKSYKNTLKSASSSGLPTELTYTSVEQIISDSKNKPLFNRAIAGTYPPGSTFKIVTAAAGLESGKITKDTKVVDTGVIQVGAFSFSNWFYNEYGRKESEPLDVVSAIKRSNDIFFYKVAEETGLDNLDTMGDQFHLSQKLGIDLPDENSGLFPSNDWKKKIIGEQWYLGDTYHLGIGQGYLLTTPLQVNSWTSVIANGGTLFKPYVVKGRGGVKTAESTALNKNFLKQETVDLIKEGMKEACEPGGTGYPFFQFKVQTSKLQVDGKNFFDVPESSTSAKPAEGKRWILIPVACKTGTAETISTENAHAWFTSYAPIADPQIAVTVLVERAGQGSEVAAPIAKKIYEEWFGR